MPNTSLAKKYKHLVDTGGTGNIEELSHDTGPYKEVSYTARFYASGIDGTAVWNAEVQPLDPILITTINSILNSSKQ